jgi:glucose 1-dehydrogenase
MLAEIRSTDSAGSSIMGRLKGKSAIVTGAASGIGRAIARRFAQEGAMVMVADITHTPKEGGAPTEDLIKEAGGTALWCHCDISKWEDVDQMVARAVAEWGKLDILVNNATTWTSTRLTETSTEQWRDVMGVNADGYFFCCKRAVQQMLTQPVVNEARGRIVNITSQHGMVAVPNDVSYGVSKATNVYITRQIAADYGRDYIICNAVAPGRIITGKPGIAQDPKSLEYGRSRTPFPRLGRPEDVANAVLFLASDECTFISGENLMVDGGWMAS